MTANQIQASVAREDARHNARVEDENQRHNEATEANANRLADIQEMIAYNTNEREKERNEIQKQYNDAWERLQYAELDQKREIQDELNMLKAADQEIQRSYNEILGEYNRQEAETHAKIAEENARHNKEMEKINDVSNYLHGMEINIKRYQAESDVMLGAMNFRLNVNNSLLNTYLGFANYEVNYLDALTRSNKANSEIFKNYAKGFGSLLNPLSNLSKNLPKLGGVTHGTSAYEEAKKFFGN